MSAHYIRIHFFMRQHFNNDGNCSFAACKCISCSLQVLKVAILAEKYATDYTWYVDTILHLIRIAGDHVSEEVCSALIGLCFFCRAGV